MDQLVTLSPKFQIVIPKKVRESLGLKPGERLHVFALDGNIRIHRPRSVQSLRGIAKGLSWKNDYRDRKDRY
jgi:AbrB family looped-hinge helix DNA binding protein